MKKNILKLAAIALLAAGAVACKKSNDDQNDIVGTWIRKSTNIGGTRDTIIFTNDNKIEKYFIEMEEEYNIGYTLKADTVIIFLKSNNINYFFEQGFKYSIKENKLTIFEFTDPFSFTNVVREDVVFKKFQ